MKTAAMRIKHRIYSLLRWSEKYTKADMVYVASGNFWILLGRSISVGSGMALTIVFANFLAPELFGTYKYIIAGAGIFSAFALGGLGGATTRAVALGNAHVVPGVFRASFLWSIPASAAALAVSAYYFWQSNITLGIGFALVAIATPLFNSTGLYKSVMLGKKDFRGLAFASFRNTIPVAGLITAVLLTQNVVVLLVTYFSLNLLVSGAMFLWTLRKYQIAGSSENVPETIRYGKHLSVMGAVSQASEYIDHLLLWHFAGPVQLATYAFALAPVRELKNFSQNVSPLLFPKYVVKTVAQMKETAPLRIKQIALLLVGVGIVYIALAPYLYELVFPKYTAAAALSQILAVGLVFQARGIVETMLYARGDTRLRYITITFTQGTRVILWLLLIPPYGVMGAVAGAVLADALSALVWWWAYKKIT